MSEQQNIEYKQSWHDDYLKWVCGFANNCACRDAACKDAACHVSTETGANNDRDAVYCVFKVVKAIWIKL